MPKLVTEIAHQLDKQEAVARLKAKSDELLHQWSQKVSDVAQEWKEDVMEFGFKAFGWNIRGKAETLDQAVRVTLELPLAAIMVQGAIESQIRKHLEEVLA